MSSSIRKILLICISFIVLNTPVCTYADGKFSFEIIRDGNPEDRKLADYIEKKGTFAKIIKALNESLVIPYDIQIIMTNSEYGPHYQPAKKLIVLDYGDERWAAAQYDKNYPDSDKKSREYYLNNINLFSLYHELGHALIDAYKIPMVGPEEDAADSLASVMLLYYFNYGDQILLDNADYFDRAREAGASQENQYWDVHALNEQRFYRLLCYAYGKSPTYVEEELKENDDEEHNLQKFLAARKDQCLYEYKKLNEAWFSILKAHFTDSEEADEAINEINQENPFDASEDAGDDTDKSDSSSDKEGSGDDDSEE